MTVLNPGKVVRQIHDEFMTRWVYETNDTAEEILGSKNYLGILKFSPDKIDAGDEIVILSRPPYDEDHKIVLTVGYNPEDEDFFPIFQQDINLATGEVQILTGLEAYFEDEEGDEDGEN